MNVSLSTLSCPDWDLDRICEAASEAGYDGVDIRGYLDEIDVTRHPRFADQVAETIVRFDDAGLCVTALSSSIRVCEAAARDDNLSEARRLVDLGTDLDVERIRVFGGGDPSSRSIEELARVGGETMADILAIDGSNEFQWMLETHDAWTAAPDWQRLLSEFPEENTGVLWDPAHTIRVAEESPAETLDALGDRLEYVHLKDAAYRPDDPSSTDEGYVYTLPGEGDLPMAEVVHELDDRGYDGWVAFEHEKRWHPSLPEPEKAIPAFAEWFDSVT